MERFAPEGRGILLHSGGGFVVAACVSRGPPDRGLIPPDPPAVAGVAPPSVNSGVQVHFQSGFPHLAHLPHLRQSGGTMSTSSIDDRRLTAARAALQGREAVQAAYLLGSAAAGRLRTDSDVDVAILPSRPAGLSVAERLALTAELTEILGRPVDLGVLSTANVVYAKEAVTTGRILWERDRITTARFAMLALSMYASLQEARREVLRAYAT